MSFSDTLLEELQLLSRMGSAGDRKAWSSAVIHGRDLLRFRLLTQGSFSYVSGTHGRWCQTLDVKNQRNDQNLVWSTISESAPIQKFLQYGKITKATKTEKSHAKTQRRKGLRQSGFNTVSHTNILGKSIAIRVSAPVKNPSSLCAFAALRENFLSAALCPL
jgi:hypothetical protein